jgi:hypothetical protein
MSFGENVVLPNIVCGRYLVDLPNGIMSNGGSPKQYKHGNLPKWQFAKSLVPRKAFCQKISSANLT